MNIRALLTALLLAPIATALPSCASDSGCGLPVSANSPFVYKDGLIELSLGGINTYQPRCGVER